MVPPVFPPRSIPPWGPPLDRHVVRAALAKGAAWPRSGDGLARLVGEALGRATGRWVAEPERALLDALDRLRPGAVLAAPSWGRSGWGDALGSRDVRWMEPARHRLDPDKARVAEAIAAGATAVLLAPVAGDCAALLGVADLCARKDVLLLVDGRAAAGGRVLDGPPTHRADLALTPPDGEPAPGPCGGAILLGDPGPSDPPRGTVELPARLAVNSLRTEPRLRRLVRTSDVPCPCTEGAPTWAFAAAAARLQQAETRASQRARHGRSLRRIISHVEGIDLPADPPGVQSAGGAVGMLVARRDEVVAHLSTHGLPSLQGALGWLAPPAARGPLATQAAEQALLLPLLPFYRPVDLDWIGETLRRATLRTVPEE